MIDETERERERERERKVLTICKDRFDQLSFLNFPKYNLESWKKRKINFIIIKIRIDT